MKKFYVSEEQLDALKGLIGDVGYVPGYLSLVCSSSLDVFAAKDALSVPLDDLRRWIEKVEAQEIIS